MRKSLIDIGLLLLVVFSVSSVVGAANHTMRYNFSFTNNPNGRQVAMNVANRQRELAQEEGEQSAVERFQESLERQVINRAIREIVESLFEDWDEDGENSGRYVVGDDVIYYERYEDGSLVIWYFDENDELTEIIISNDDNADFPAL